MKEYKFSKENARKHIRARFLSRIPIIIASIIAGGFIANYQTDGRLIDDKLVLILTIIVSGISITIGIFLGLKRGTESLLYERYRLNENIIERLTPSGKTISIELKSVISHKSLRDGLLLKSKGKKLIIPSGLDNFDEISNLILEGLK